MKLPDWVQIIDTNARWLRGESYSMASTRIPNLFRDLHDKPVVILCMKDGHSGGRQYETMGRAVYWAARPDTWCDACASDESSQIARIRVLSDLTNKPKPVVVEPIPTVKRRRRTRKG